LAMNIESIVLRFRPVLAASERAAMADRAAVQQQLLRRLLTHARASVPFYREQLAGLDLEVVGPGTEAWSALPLLTRATLQARRADLASEAVPKEVGTVSSGATSGSTGRPVRYLETELSGAASQAQTDRLMRWWTIDGAKTLCLFLATHQAAGGQRVTVRPAGGQAFRAAGRMNSTCSPISTASSNGWSVASRPMC